MKKSITLYSVSLLPFCMFKFDVPGSDNLFLSLSVWFAFSKQTNFYILLKHKQIFGCAPAESNTALAYTTSIPCHTVTFSPRPHKFFTFLSFHIFYTDRVECRAKTYSWKSIVPLQSLSNTRKIDSARNTASLPSAVFSWSFSNLVLWIMIYLG